MNRSSLRPVSRKRASAGRERAKAERALGRDGLTGICARCARLAYVNGHERLARAQGGNPARPDCLLCVPCNEWCESYPVTAAWDGWKVSRKNPADPGLAALAEGWRVQGVARTIHGDYVKFPQVAA